MESELSALPDRHDRRIVAWMGAALAIVLLMLSFGHIESLDAEMDYQTVRGIVVHRDFAVHADNPAGAAILAGQEEMHFGGSFGRNGKFYSWHGPGRAVMAVPFYLVGKLAESIWPECEERYARSAEHQWVTEAAPKEVFPRLFFALSSACFGALAAICVYLSARVLRASRGAALVAALALVTATWFGPATRSALNAMQVSGLLALGTYGLLRYVQSGQHGAARPLSLWGLFVLGLVLGICVWTRPTESFAVMTLSLLALLAAWRRRGHGRPVIELAVFTVGALLVAGAMLFLNYHRFGDFREFGHGDAIKHEGFLIKDPLLLALNELFLLFSPGKGVAIFAPPLLLLVTLWFGRGQRLERTLLVAAAATFFLWPIFSSGWHGGPFYGPRYVTPALPLIAIALARPVGELWHRRRAVRVLVVLLIGLGVTINLPAFLVSYRTVHELSTTVARREVPMPPMHLEQYALAVGVDANLWASLDNTQRATLEQRADYAFDNEQRQYFMQVHPLFFPPRIFATIAWHRLMKPSVQELERLEFAWIASPLEPPLTMEAAERSAWRPPQSLPLEEISLVPSGLEMRGFSNLWPIAFATRFPGFPLRVLVFAALGVFLVCSLALVHCLRRAVCGDRSAAPSDLAP